MDRVTVDLTDYPELVVVYLGMRVTVLRGVLTLLGFGPKISAVAKDMPDGLLGHENIIYSLFPLHIGMRQYWRDFQSLEKWSHSEPHRVWWKGFLKDPKGTGFWHEAYFKQGGFEAVYVNIPDRLGLRQFAPEIQARGSMFTARQRIGRTQEHGQEKDQNQANAAPVITENDLYKKE
jgi:hypothetical protein